MPLYSTYSNLGILFGWRCQCSFSNVFLDVIVMCMDFEQFRFMSLLFVGKVDSEIYSYSLNMYKKISDCLCSRNHS